MKRSAGSPSAGLGAWSYIWTTMLTAWICVFAFPFVRILGEYQALFRAFGAELPAFTGFIFRQKMLVWLWLVLLALFQIGLLIRFYRVNTRQARSHVKWLTAFHALHQVAFVVAMYLPIIKLGAVV
jgi:type II secretory pathway component PulF